MSNKRQHVWVIEERWGHRQWAPIDMDTTKVRALSCLLHNYPDTDWVTYRVVKYVRAGKAKP